MNHNNDLLKAIRLSSRLSLQPHMRFIVRLREMSAAEIIRRIVLRIRYASVFKSNYLQNYLNQSLECGKQLVSALGNDPIGNISKIYNERFFFGPSDKAIIIANINDCCPDDVDKTIELAEELCQSGICLLGQQFQPLSANFDWQADPLSGVRIWPDGWLDEASAISVENADVKYIWEVNRLQFLPLLGRAYWITGDEKYAKHIVEVIERWILANPAGKGVNWCSHLEVSMRAISWLWVMPVLLTWDKFEDAFLKRWLISIGQHYYHLKENLSEFTDPTNHLIGETTGLYMLCCCFPQLPDSEKNKNRAYRILVNELVSQNTKDGVNKEHASSYHRFVLDFYIQVLLLARKQKKPLPDVNEKQVMAMCEFQSFLAGSSGQAPMIGDSDDARGVPFPENIGWDFKDIPATGALLFDRPEWWSGNRELPGLSQWLLGKEAGKASIKQNVPDVNCGVRLFRDGGYCFFQNDGNFGKADLLFDVGSFGLWPNASHAHADSLSLMVRLNGRILLGDPGTGTYFGSETIRNIFRKTSSHNTVTVDQLDQADIYGTFKWVNPFSATLSAAGEDCGFAYASASHNGYQRLKNPVTHSRSILSVNSFGWLVLDCLDGAGSHLLDWNFHFPPETAVARRNSRTFLAKNTNDTAGMMLMFINATSDNTSHVNVDKCGLWSTEYGKWEASPGINIQLHNNLPVYQLTLLIPVMSDSENVQVMSESVRINKIGHSACHITFTNAEGGVILILVNPENEIITLSDIGETDAEILFLQKSSAGKLLKACVTGKERYLHSEMLNLKSNINTNIAGHIGMND